MSDTTSNDSGGMSIDTPGGAEGVGSSPTSTPAGPPPLSSVLSPSQYTQMVDPPIESESFVGAAVAAAEGVGGLVGLGLEKIGEFIDDKANHGGEATAQQQPDGPSTESTPSGSVDASVPDATTLQESASPPDGGAGSFTAAQDFGTSAEPN